MTGPQRSAVTLNEAALIAATGISERNLIRWRQQGLVPIAERRHGRGRGGGTTPLEYPAVSVQMVRRIHELRQEFKEIIEWRWHLWCEGYPVRIAPDLADLLGRLGGIASEIKTLDDIEKISAKLWKRTNLPRGNPLRAIFGELDDDDLRALSTMAICVLFGIRLPLFDEPNPHPFRVFKRAFGLPKEWQLPPGIFDIFPNMHEQIRTALSMASADELECARGACRFLCRLLDKRENARRSGVLVRASPLRSRPIALASLMWASPLVRAATVGLVIFGVRGFKSARGEEAVDAFNSIASAMSIFFPVSGPEIASRPVEKI